MLCEHPIVVSIGFNSVSVLAWRLLDQGWTDQLLLVSCRSRMSVSYFLIAVNNFSCFACPCASLSSTGRPPIFREWIQKYPSCLGPGTSPKNGSELINGSSCQVLVDSFVVLVAGQL